MPTTTEAARGWTVRARVLSYLVGLVAAAVTVTGLVSHAIQVRELDHGIDSDLEARTQAFLDLASDNDPATGEPWAGPDHLLRRGIQSVVATETESAVGHIDGVARFAPGGGDRLDLAADAEFLDYATANTSTVVAVQSVTTEQAQYRFVSVPLTGADGTVVATFTIATDRGELLHELHESFQGFVIAGAIALTLAGVVGWITVGRLLRPIRLLDEAAREIGETDLSRRIPIVGNDDLARLSETVNAMLDRLESGFAAQRQLLDDAGHELRTPLAVMRTNLEMLEPRDADQVVDSQRLLLDEIAMMSRLVDDLVVLAKSDRPEFVTAEPLDVADLTDAAFARAQALGDREWSVEERGEGVVWGDQQRLLQAWMQLVANAVKFSDEGSAIALGSAVDSSELRLWVRDHGRGIPPSEHDNVMKRFHRVDNSVEGAGLGLPIVRAIAAAHGGRVELESVKGSGSLFTIVIPAPQETS